MGCALVIALTLLLLYWIVLAMDENKFKYDKKLKGVVVERSVVYGSEAHWLGRRAGEGVSTHKW